jgi:hypothetical protein
MQLSLLLLMVTVATVHAPHDARPSSVHYSLLLRVLGRVLL